MKSRLELEKKPVKLQNDRRAKKGTELVWFRSSSKNAFVHRMYFSSYVYGGEQKKICIYLEKSVKEKKNEEVISVLCCST